LNIFFKFLIEVVGEKEFESEDIEKKYFLLYEKYSANLISESNSITQKHITSFSYSSLLPLKITIALDIFSKETKKKIQIQKERMYIITIIVDI
jgi:hypothetical protein